MVELQESGFCVITPYRIGGQLCLRAALCNHRTRLADVSELARRVVALGQRFLEDGGAAAGPANVTGRHA
jgi:aromatic-L-amino-acid/L-tryptophan decarboxylase